MVKPWFLSKKGHFFIFFFFRQYKPGKYLYDILERKNAFLGYKNKKFKKSRNWHFSKGFYPMVFVQKCPFFEPFFFGNIHQEHVFYDILEGENVFLGNKNKKFKKPKSDICRKGLTHVFGPKMAIFPSFLFGNRGHENVFYNIVEQNCPASL